MPERIILHFDMNSYFASVEQQANPFYRGKPLGVCSTMTTRGCIIASSKEAKAVGIVTGMRVNEALEIYSEIKLVEVDPPKYRTTTQRIFNLCAEYTEEIEAYSIDEAFLDLTGYVDSVAKAKKIAATIQQRIKDEIGEWLDCSMGIAWTRWLAKFASDTAPKGTIVILTKQNLFRYLWGKDLQDAWGIAGATSRALNEMGIYTLDQLYSCPVQNLHSVFGVRGYYLWANVNGVELSGLEVKRPPKSIGHSHVLRRRTADPKFHRAVVMRLAERTSRRLREKGYEAKGIYWGVRFHERPSWHGSHRVHYPLTTSYQIYKFIWRKVEPVVKKDLPAMFALGLFRLQPRVNQLSLFGRKKLSPAVSKALDEINNKYGEEMIVQGPLLRLENIHVPDRIGFRKTVDAEFENTGNVYQYEEK